MISGLLLLLSLNFSNLVPKIDINRIVDSAKGNSAMEISSDPAFATQVLKFDADQTIYVRVSAQNDGSAKHDLNLRDNNYNLLKTYTMAKSDNRFLVNFPAPNAAGIYSLEANIESSGSVTNFVKTIEVGDAGSNNSQVNVKINNQVNTGNQVLSEKSQANAFPGPSIQASPVPTQNPAARGFFTSLWAKVVELFKGFF